MNKFWQFLSGSIFKDLGKIIDDVITTDEERLQVKKQIEEMILSKHLEVTKMQADVINTEAKGNWLQRSWRPILMLSFGFIILYSKFIAPAFGLPNTELEPDFWGLLKLGIGGYVIGRTAEQITKTVVPNIQFKKK